MPYCVVRLSDHTRLTDPAELPSPFRGRLTQAKLADLSWITDADLAAEWSGKGLWPVVEVPVTLAPYDPPIEGKKSWQRFTGGSTLAVDVEGRRVLATRQVEPRPAAEVRAEKLEGLAAWRYDLEIGGTPIEVGEATVPIATDRGSQQQIDAMQRALADGVIPSVRFRLAAGVIVAADLAQANAIRAVVVGHVQGCRDVEADYSEAILGLGDDSEAIGLHDYRSGWPGSS